MKWLFILLIFASCGSRKSARSSSENKTKTELETVITDTSKIVTNLERNTKESKSSEVDQQTGIVTETETVEPLDISKPAIVVNEDGTKTELNNAKRIKTKSSVLSSSKSKDISNIQESEKAAQIEDKRIRAVGKSTSESSTKSDTKNVDRKPPKFSLWWLLLLAIPITAIYIYNKTRQR